MGWRMCDPVENPTLRGRLTAAPDLHVDVAFFRIANRAPSAPEDFSWRPARCLHERTVQNLVSLAGQIAICLVQQGRQLQELQDPSPSRPSLKKPDQRLGDLSQNQAIAPVADVDPKLCQFAVRAQLLEFSAVPHRARTGDQSGVYGFTRCRVFDNVGHET